MSYVSYIHPSRSQGRMVHAIELLRTLLLLNEHAAAHQFGKMVAYGRLRQRKKRRTRRNNRTARDRSARIGNFLDHAKPYLIAERPIYRNWVCLMKRHTFYYIEVFIYFNIFVHLFAFCYKTPHTTPMAFNHYAKIKRILSEQSNGWYIRRIDEPTSAKNFKGELVRYDHYYRIYSVDGQPIKYCKFQKIDKLAQILGRATEELPVAL